VGIVATRPLAQKKINVELSPAFQQDNFAGMRNSFSSIDNKIKSRL
jgi:hypothetical protein